MHCFPKLDANLYNLQSFGYEMYKIKEYIQAGLLAILHINGARANADGKKLGLAYPDPAPTPSGQAAHLSAPPLIALVTLRA